MFPIIGFIIIFSSVIGGFMMAGGNPSLLLQPVEFIVIMGVGIGSLFIANPAYKLIQILKEIPKIFIGSRYKKKDYLDMLTFLGALLKIAKTKGFLALEKHIENPQRSEIFIKFPKFKSDEILLKFTQEYLRSISMGVDNPYHLEEVISMEIDQQSSHYLKNSAKILQILADSLPALGIVAAVLGVILAMAAIAESPEILGHLIGAALVGTFFGVFISYGIVGPIANHLLAINEQDMYMQKCIHQVLSSFLHGYPPIISVELGRKILPITCKPSFLELEASLNQFSKETAEKTNP